MSEVEKMAGRETSGERWAGDAAARTYTKTATILFLLIEAFAVVLWWLWLVLVPAARSLFVALGAPDSTLLAFLPADILLYASSGLTSAYGLARRRSWAWPLLCFHTGCACYAALYAVGLLLFSGDGALGAALMLPALVILPVLTWLLRPRGAGEEA